MWTLVTAWRIVKKRASSDWLMLTAAVVTVGLATTLLAAGPIYSDAVTLSALQRTLEGTPSDEANVQISVPVKPERVALIDGVARPEISRTFAAVDHAVYESIESESYGLPIQTDGEATNIAVFKFLEAAQEHVTVTAGTWPVSDAEIPQTAVSETVADALTLSVGDELLMTNRRTPDEQRTVTIAAIYTPDDVLDPFWFNDPLTIQGATHSASFNTFGPLLVERSTLFSELTVVNARLHYNIFVDNTSITVQDLPTLISSLPGLEDRLNRAMSQADTGATGAFRDFSADITLRSVLLEADRSLEVTRSGVLMLSLQLSILAGLALMFTAGLLVESRRGETDLLRSRGATNRQVLGVAGVEGLLLTVPAALLAPTLSTWALRLLNHVGPLASIGLELHPNATRGAYVLAFLAAGACTLALSVPAFRSAKSFGQFDPKRGRQGSKGTAQKTGLDLALLALAVIGFWQLDVHGPTITASTRDRFGVDPLLIAGPAVGLVAGSVLALRIVPLLARASDGVASATRSTVGALSAWQMARRPMRYARSALLLIMAITIGLFATTFTATWIESQEDQATFDVGADIRVLPDRRINGSVPDLYLSDAYGGLDQVDASMPVIRKSGGGTGVGDIRRFAILDAADAGKVAQVRDDLGPDFADAMQTLVEHRPTLATTPLPGSPERIAATFGILALPLPEALEDGARADVCFCPSAQLVIQDADALLHRVDLGPIDLDAGLQRLETDLRFRLGDGSEAAPRYPLSLVDIEIRTQAPLRISREGVVTFDGVWVSQELQGEAWTPAITDFSPATWQLTATDLAAAVTQPSVVQNEESADIRRFDIETGQSAGQSPLPAYFSIRPKGQEIEDPFPFVTTDRLLAESGMAVGDVTRLRALQIADDVAEVAGAVTSFPTIDPAGGEAVIVDLPTFQMVSYESGRRIEAADEYWLSTGDSESESASGILRGSRFNSLDVIDGDEVADRKKTDPIALGTIGSLSTGFVAAAVFAAIGFAISATVSVRDRLTEFAVLRTLGLSNRQLGSWLVLEQGALVALSLALGTALGLLLSWVALPLVSVTQSGRPPTPSLLLVFPWKTMLLLEVAVVACLVVMVTLMLVGLRQMRLSALVRRGVD